MACYIQETRLTWYALGGGMKPKITHGNYTLKCEGIIPYLASKQKWAFSSQRSAIVSSSCSSARALFTEGLDGTLFPVTKSFFMMTRECLWADGDRACFT